MRASTEQNEKIHICYWPAERSVLGKTVPEVLSTARGQSFSRPRPANNVSITFFGRVLSKQFLC